MVRDREKLLKEYLDTKNYPFDVLIVQGARQVGKSTLISDSLKDQTHLFINLETDRITRSEIDKTNSFDEFTLLLETKYSFNKDNKQSILYIDEAQESIKIGQYVREMKEIWKSTKVILSGSSMSQLFEQENTRVPVGRIKYLNVYPFSFREFLRWHQKEHLIDEAIKIKENISDFLHTELISLFDDYLLTGGLPEVVKAFPNPGYKKILQDIYLSQKEDFQRKEPREPYLFSETLQGISNHVGYPSKYSHVSSNLYQAKKILSKLIHWNLVYNIDMQSHNTTSTISNKRYVYDLGVLNLLRNVPTPKIDILETLDEALRQPLGGILENAVLNEYLANEHSQFELSSWKKNSKQNIEVDFIFQIENQKVPVEVKATLHSNERHCKNLVTYLNLFYQKKGLLVSLDKYKKMKFDDFLIYNVPIYFPVNRVDSLCI